MGRRLNLGRCRTERDLHMGRIERGLMWVSAGMEEDEKI